jgi:hypothetical protein
LVGKPAARGRLGDVAADPAHARTIADDPAERAIQRGDLLDHRHEFERRQLRPAQCPGKPQPEQAGGSECFEHGRRKPALAIELVSQLGDIWSKPRNDLQIARDDGRMIDPHIWVRCC